MCQQRQPAYRKGEVLFSSLAVLDPRVGHTMDVLCPFIPVLWRERNRGERERTWRGEDRKEGRGGREFVLCPTNKKEVGAYGLERLSQKQFLWTTASGGPAPIYIYIYIYNRSSQSNVLSTKCKPHKQWSKALHKRLFIQVAGLAVVIPMSHTSD